MIDVFLRRSEWDTKIAGSTLSHHIIKYFPTKKVSFSAQTHIVNDKLLMEQI